MNEEISKAIISGKMEVDIVMDDPKEYENLSEWNKEQLMIAEHELTCAFNNKGYLTRYDLWGALGIDLAPVAPFENKVLIRRW